MNSTLQRNSIINRALRICGAIASGQNATAQQVSEAASALQSVLTELKTEGFNQVQIVTTPYALTASSQVTNNGTNYTCIQSHTSAASNEPGVGALSSSYWAARGTTGVAWALATPYTNIAYKTLNATTEDVLVAYIRDDNGNDNYPLELISESRYAELTPKDRLGRPTKMLIRYSSPRQIVLYDQPDTTDYTLVLSEVVNLTLPTLATSTLAQEDYWDSAIVYSLAAELAPEYGLPLPERSWLRVRAAEKVAKAKAKEYRPESNDHIYGAY